jgi:hypothetical protein
MVQVAASVLVTGRGSCNKGTQWNAGPAASNHLVEIAQHLLFRGKCRVIQNTRQSGVAQCQAHPLALRVIHKLYERPASMILR